MNKVIILGGGLAGLSTGWKLSSNGFDVEVFEADSQVGGLAKSLRRGDFILDTGPHRFFSKNPQIISEIKNLMGEEFVLRVRKSKIYVNDRYLDYPVTGRSIMQMDKSAIVVAIADYIFHILKNKVCSVPNDSFESYVVNHFGRTLYKIFFADYTAKLWGIHPDNISADWAAQRISLPNLGDVIKKVFLRKEKEDTHRTYASVFYYPKNGIGSISDALSQAIVGNGGMVRLNAMVNGLEVDDRRITAITYINPYTNHEERVNSDLVVSTIPITNLVKILKPGVSPDVLDCANKLNYRALVFLYFIIGKEQISDNHWLYFPEGKYLFNRISESKVFSENMSPAGKTSLCIEISCNVGYNIYNAAPQELLAQTIDGLEEVGLVKRHEIIDFFMHKEAYAYPIYDFSYKENLKTVMSYVERIENLFSIGRQGLFRYNNMDHSIEMGFKTAEAIINGGKLDTTWVAMKDEYFG